MWVAEHRNERVKFFIAEKEKTVTQEVISKVEQKPPFPTFTREAAAQKVRMAIDVLPIPCMKSTYIN
jgi:hypothetical protein